MASVGKTLESPTRSSSSYHGNKKRGSFFFGFYFFLYRRQLANNWPLGEFPNVSKSDATVFSVSGDAMVARRGSRFIAGEPLSFLMAGNLSGREPSGAVFSCLTIGFSTRDWLGMVGTGTSLNVVGGAGVSYATEENVSSQVFKREKKGVDVTIDEPHQLLRVGRCRLLITSKQLALSSARRTSLPSTHRRRIVAIQIRKREKTSQRQG